MAQTTADAGAQDEEAKLDPRSLAKSVVLSVAEEPEEVGDFAQSIDLGDNVTDFRFVCHRKGYEGWQWAVTLYHDVELDSWSVNESTLVPTKDSLLAPAWIPWKDRLEAADLSVTDSLGTDPDDPRMEDGFRKTEVVEKDSVNVAETSQDDSGSSVSGQKIAENDVEPNGSGSSETSLASDQAATAATSGDKAEIADVQVEETAETDAQTQSDADIDPETGLSRELEDAVEEFGLSRRHVMSELGRSQTAKRWYDGQHGPKSLSTKTAEGNLCSTCAFFIGLKGDLDTMFGVCANRWSPDDGRVVSLDHGCGEHSEIEQPEPSHLWVQSKPAFDDLHIDIIAQAPREERGQVELIESIDEDDESDDDETATENDIAEHAIPGSLEDDDDENEDEDDAQGTVGSAVTADVAVESTIDLSDEDDSDEDDADDESADDDSDDETDQSADDEPEDDGPDEADDEDEETETSDNDDTEDSIEAGNSEDANASDTSTQADDVVDQKNTKADTGDDEDDESKTA
ncbi:DUF3027 domain-containing protein [Bifidobacterium sp. ESL0775]|uniref:DUF3027 domain-containing protein n=1 Tax=Bifidobacterium sp. ESL0775 TaxID=2983230 RepID=UPI0023F67DE4|nr:DUF3027 domain-containing protein [Bifidobacterium sp. ESL0775]WEV70083.1 DUF3027 domain-containing protein [Bifidobacterium sp. ESL0775]